MTTTPERIDYLDGWRGVAISLLMVGHFLPFWLVQLSLGTAGVHFFFVLSGFLIARQLFVHQIPISVFYKRRISRIFPTLYLFIGVIIICYLIANNPMSWDMAIGAILLIRNYFPARFGNELPFDHIWSLSVEEHSYILLSIIALVWSFKIDRQKFILGALSLFFASMCFWYSVFYPGPELYVTKIIHSEVAAFGIFFSGFLLLCFKNGIDRNIPSFVFYALAIIGIGGHYFSATYTMTLFFGVGSLALLVNILHKAPVWMLRVLSFPPLRKLGLASYSIYLWQQPFYALKQKGLLPPISALILALLVGLVSYHLFESPLRAYLNRTWAKN